MTSLSEVSGSSSFRVYARFDGLGTFRRFVGTWASEFVLLSIPEAEVVNKKPWICGLNAKPETLTPELERLNKLACP